uniref:Uncharacterized protein n=1 Tax=Micrurus paraensis TaxID=1970185 RepID=A0A2D4KGS9_9SAUR
MLKTNHNVLSHISRPHWTKSYRLSFPSILFKFTPGLVRSPKQGRTQHVNCLERAEGIVKRYISLSAIAMEKTEVSNRFDRWSCLSDTSWNPNFIRHYPNICYRLLDSRPKMPPQTHQA